MSASNLPIPSTEPSGKVAEAILGFLSKVPESSHVRSLSPEAEARKLRKSAAMRASMVAGSLSLPPGPLGWLTLVPEMVKIWKI